MRLLALAVLGLLSVVALSSCNEADDGKPKIGFITNSVADFWTIAVKGAHKAAKEFDVDLTVSQPTSEGKLIQQKNFMEDMVSQGFDGIAISPVDSENQVPLMNDIAKRAALITHDSDAPKSNRACFIGVDNYVAGRMCGELVRDALPNGGKIMLFIGNLDGDNGPSRRQGLIDVLFGRSNDPKRRDPVGSILVSEDKSWTILGCQTDGFDRTKAKNQAVDTLTKYPDIDGMVGLYEYNPPAILQALTQAKKLGKVKVVGFDENFATLQGIRDGNVHGTIAQDPFMYGYLSVKLLAQIAGGDKSMIPANKIIDVPATKVLAANVDAFEDELRLRIGKPRNQDGK